MNVREKKDENMIKVGIIGATGYAGGELVRMTAVINGESISHEITQKQYDRYLRL